MCSSWYLLRFDNYDGISNVRVQYRNDVDKLSELSYKTNKNKNADFKDIAFIVVDDDLVN